MLTNIWLKVTNDTRCGMLNVCMYFFITQINIDYHTREQIKRSVKSPTIHCFDDAQKIVYGLMERDSYPRFLRSDMYRTLLENLAADGVKGWGGLPLYLPSWSPERKWHLQKNKKNWTLGFQESQTVAAERQYPREQYPFKKKNKTKRNYRKIHTTTTLMGSLEKDLRGYLYRILYRETKEGGLEWGGRGWKPQRRSWADGWWLRQCHCGETVHLRTVSLAKECSCSLEGLAHMVESSLLAEVFPVATDNDEEQSCGPSGGLWSHSAWQLL